MSKALNSYAGSVRALIALHHGLKRKKLVISIMS